MPRLTHIIRLALLLSLCLVLAGCGKPRIDLAVASQPNLNPDHSGRPSPVVIKMYEMRGDLAFKQSDFHTLFAEPMKALGSDLVAADEIVFVPSEAKTISYEPMPDTRFVGIVAGFRQMDRAHWRISIPVDPESKNRIPLELNDVFITLIGQNQSDWTPEDSLRRQQGRMTPQPVYTEPASTSAVEPAAGQGYASTMGSSADPVTSQSSMGQPAGLHSSGTYDTGVTSRTGAPASTGSTGSIGAGSSTGSGSAQVDMAPRGQQQGSYVTPHSKRTP